MSKNNGSTASSSPANISVTSLIKQAENSTAAVVANGHSGGPSGTGTGPSKQFLADDYMAKVLGGRAAEKGPRVLGGRAVRQVLSNKV